MGGLTSAAARVATRGHRGECFICGRVRPVRMKAFVVFGRWIQDWICRPCYQIPGDEPNEGTPWEVTVQ